MKLYSENENYKLYHGSMLDMLEVIEPNTIDSIVCDPPYELNFMGKGWDNSGIAFQKETWEQCFKALKEGGYLLAFGGSRTFHRIACAIEDAGFEIRDTIMYLYGSGFPKSMNIGKALEKRLDDERTKEKTEHDLRLMWERDIQKTKYNESKQREVLQSQLQEQSLQEPSSENTNVWGKEPSLEGWNNIQKTEGELQRCKVCEMSQRISINGEERWICNGTQISNGKETREMFEKSGSCSSYRPQPKQQQDRELNVIQEQWGTQESREVIDYWKQYGSCLKPAFEPVIVARKPFKGSLVDNVINNGVGGLNIDECRVPTSDTYSYKNGAGGCSFGVGKGVDGTRTEPVKSNDLGRFPANVILTYDDTDYEEVCGGFPNTKGGTKKLNSEVVRKGISADGSSFNSNTCGFDVNKGTGLCNYGDSGSASRYFYCAKASKKDRDEGLDEFEESKTTDGCIRSNEETARKFGANSALRKNTHPTVKPTDLMQYLVRLVTPKGGVVLDPFNGSGSTGKAVMYENREREADYKYIGIELTEEYLPIAKARIEYVENLKEETMKQVSIFDIN